MTKNQNKENRNWPCQIANPSPTFMAKKSNLILSDCKVVQSKSGDDMVCQYKDDEVFYHQSHCHHWNHHQNNQNGHVINMSYTMIVR